MNWVKKIIDEHHDLQDKINNLFNIAPNSQELITLQKQSMQINNKYSIAKEASNIQNNLLLLEEMINDLTDDDKEAAIKEYNTAKERLVELNEQFFHKDLTESKVILEIRPGVGGKEACLFVDLLAAMYEAYFTEKKWLWEVFSLDYNTMGGIESIVIGIEGLGVFDNIQYESGIHRIQRIPITESCGRIHTSTATVAVLFEPEEVDVEINEKYLKIEVFRAGGAGGQHVNKTESAVRLTYAHPEMDKIVVSIQDEKSQHKNKSKAMKILRAKIAQSLKDKTHADQASKRKSQVGNADRSEKIRTYNFPQNRVTDHRVNISAYSIQKQNLLSPKDLQIIIDGLIKSYDSI